MLPYRPSGAARTATKPRISRLSRRRLAATMPLRSTSGWGRRSDAPGAQNFRVGGGRVGAAHLAAGRRPVHRRQYRLRPRDDREVDARPDLRPRLAFWSVRFVSTAFDGRTLPTQ